VERRLLFGVEVEAAAFGCEDFGCAYDGRHVPVTPVLWACAFRAVRTLPVRADVMIVTCV
jgi:hypothetical protein